MSKRQKTYLQKLTEQIIGKDSIKTKFSKRVEEGALTRDENPITHFCVYFAAYDPESQQVFIGHHKKSGLWLFNGGHIDEGEMPLEALEREVREEWGANTYLKGNYEPSLLTITKINNPTKQKCRLHYDIWYFIPLNKDTFVPEEKLLEKEFHQTGWKALSEARQLIKDANTLLALNEVEKLFL